MARMVNIQKAMDASRANTDLFDPSAVLHQHPTGEADINTSTWCRYATSSLAVSLP